METVLAADVGGTHCTLALVKFENNNLENNKPVIIARKEYLTETISNFSNVVSDFLDYCTNKLNNQKIPSVKIEKTKMPVKAGIGAAGAVSDGRVMLTNANLVVDVKELQEKTCLKKITLLNDFQVLALGVPFLSSADLTSIYALKNTADLNHHVTDITEVAEITDVNDIQLDKSQLSDVKLVIGPGTGLGKSVLVYDKHSKTYTALASEGGHADLPLQTEFDIAFAEYLRNKKKNSGYILNYHDVLSSKGLCQLYSFFAGDKHEGSATEIPFSTATEICLSRKTDERAEKAMRSFFRYFAQCCRNSALEFLSYDGIYLAGGFSQRYPEYLDELFVKEFLKHGSVYYQKILKKIPIYLIKNNDVSLLGAGYAGTML